MNYLHSRCELIYKQSLDENAVQLIFMHGCLGSFNEVRKILPMLTYLPGGEALDVVASRYLFLHISGLSNGSLPRYCWSVNPSKKGFNLRKIADVNKLMITLAYKKYVAQGGERGSLMTRPLGQLYPKNCKVIDAGYIEDYSEFLI